MTKMDLQTIRELAIAIKTDCDEGSGAYRKAQRILEIVNSEIDYYAE
jgi:hypothetical protein